MTPVTAVLDARTATDHLLGIGRYVVNLAQVIVGCGIVETYLCILSLHA